MCTEASLYPSESLAGLGCIFFGFGSMDKKR
jgi:hypothetical protein